MSALAARRRSLLMDMAALATTLHPPLQITSPDEFPLACRPGQAGPAGSGKLLIVFNHYSGTGVPAWWTAIALGGALVRVA